jgi:two-component system OmpR family sensor kinase
MRPAAFRLRLILLQTSTVSCLLVVAALAGNWALSRVVRGQLDAALLALAEGEAAALQADPRAPVRVHELAPGASVPSFARLDRFVQICSRDGRVLAASANLGTARLPLSAATLQVLGRDEVVLETVHHFGDEPVRVIAVPLRVRDEVYVIQVAGSLDDVHAIVRAGRWLFGGLSVALLVAVAFTSAFVARRAVKPIDDIVRRARSIGESNLEERLPHRASQDELGRLVDTLNAMLERVQRGVEAQRRFTADASHELRSPLSRLRAELEVTLRRKRDPGEYEEALRSCLDEVQRLSQLAEELLTLARLESERPGGERPPVPLLPIVDEAMRHLGRQARRCAILPPIDRDSSTLAVRASPTAVRLALANVLENAVKFSPPEGEVHVDISTDGPDVLIVIRDEGPGFRPGELREVFGRFHRGAAAHEGDAPGFGLGLAISKAAIEREGGRIVAEAGPRGGALFRIRLPLAG